MEIEEAINLVKDLAEKSHPQGLTSREALETLIQTAQDYLKLLTKIETIKTNSYMLTFKSFDDYRKTVIKWLEEGLK